MHYDFSRYDQYQSENNYVLYQFNSLTLKQQNIKKIDRLFGGLPCINRIETYNDGMKRQKNCRIIKTYVE